MVFQMLLPMQQFITSDEYSQYHSSGSKVIKSKIDTGSPSPELIKNLMAYAVAMRVIKTKCFGNFYLVMN